MDFSCGFLGAADAPEREAKRQGAGSRRPGDASRRRRNKQEAVSRNQEAAAGALATAGVFM